MTYLRNRISPDTIQQACWLRMVILLQAFPYGKLQVQGRGKQFCAHKEAHSSTLAWNEAEQRKPLKQHKAQHYSYVTISSVRIMLIFSAAPEHTRAARERKRSDGGGRGSESRQALRLPHRSPVTCPGTTLVRGWPWFSKLHWYAKEKVGLWQVTAATCSHGGGENLACQSSCR